MNMHLMMVLTIFCMGIFDRMRGGDYLVFGGLRLGRHIGQVGMPLVAAIALHTHGWMMAYAVVSVFITTLIGVNPSLAAVFTNGAMPGPFAWWQFGPFKRSALAAVVLRGVIWGLPLILINPWAVLAFAIPYTVTPYLARWFFPISMKPLFDDRWAIMEFARGLLIGFGLCL